MSYDSVKKFIKPSPKLMSAYPVFITRPPVHKPPGAKEDRSPQGFKTIKGTSSNFCQIEHLNVPLLGRVLNHFFA